jgi:hypothetical protein
VRRFLPTLVPRRRSLCCALFTRLALFPSIFLPLPAVERRRSEVLSFCARLSADPRPPRVAALSVMHNSPTLLCSQLYFYPFPPSKDGGRRFCRFARGFTPTLVHHASPLSLLCTILPPRSVPYCTSTPSRRRKTEVGGFVVLRRPPSTTRRRSLCCARFSHLALIPIVILPLPTVECRMLKRFAAFLRSALSLSPPSVLRLTLVRIRFFIIYACCLALRLAIVHQQFCCEPIVLLDAYAQQRSRDCR